MFHIVEDSNSLHWLELNGETYDGPYLYRAEAEERKKELESE